MAKLTFADGVLNSVVRAAGEARVAGKTWGETLAVAQAAGYTGGRSTLQKLVDANPSYKMGHALNRRIVRPAVNKNEVKTADEPVTSANAFARSAADAPSSESPRASETLASIQNRLPVLRDGAEYARPISLFQGCFHHPSVGELNAWSRILEKEEAVCVVNSNEQFPRGADVLVDSALNPPGSSLTVIHATSHEYAPGTQLPVQRRDDGTAYVSIRELQPTAMLVLSNSTVAL